MSSLFNLKIPAPEKIVQPHPWEKVIKDEYASKIKYAHNSIKNPKYPREEVKPKTLVVSKKSPVRFTIVGNRVTKEFTYCVNIVKGLHKYRSKHFDPPIIRAVTSVEWPSVWNDLKIRYGELAFCIDSQVAVIMNDTFLGGENELKQLVESNYVYHLCLDYFKEGVDRFATYVRSSGRPCAYLHISIDDKEAGSMIFMLYSDIVPLTCDNFLRLCKQTKGGYGGTPVHRIVKDGWIQCGGYGLKNNKDLSCENFIVPHDKRGVLCMANDGRHVDCSTQFFVLLQPAPWMAHKYVAFGQLIDGESTLQKIEQVPTFYESPTKNITIFKSGILNMDCQDITINKKAKEYIFGHVEDLFVIGELFYESLLEHVWAEIERREQMALTAIGEMEGETEGEGDLMKDSKRFHSNKEDIEKQLDKSKGEIAPEEGAPEEYQYDYEYEGSLYKPASDGPAASLIVKPEKPFYLPLTDVPYPDEVDSTYDLKKFLRGDYCHEIDLEVRLEPMQTMKAYPSEMLMLDESEGTPSLDLDSDEEKEISKYLSQNVDRMSFAGDTVKKMSRGFAKLNIFDGDETPEVITDELLRKVRTQLLEQQSRRAKKVSVSINVDEDKVHHKIKRRQTGFVKPTELERIRMLARLKELREQSDEEDDLASKKASRMSLGEAKISKKPRRSEFVRAEDLAKIRVIERDDDWEDNDKKVRISKPHDDKEEQKRRAIARRPTGFVRAMPLPDPDDSEIDIHRPSVLQRLYEDVAVDDEEEGPTLKDYRPKSELSQSKKLNLLLTPDKVKLTNENDKYLRPSMYNANSKYKLSDESQVLNFQHGKMLGRKISSDYVKTIDSIEKRQLNSIRSIEFSKLRPALSVMDYQTKNSKYQEGQRNTSKQQVKEVKPEDNLTSTVGLRLPGDTPLYSNDSTNVKAAEDQASQRVKKVHSKLSRIVQS